MQAPEYELSRNTLLGMLLSILLWYFSDLAVLRDVESFSLDLMIKLHQLDVLNEASNAYAILHVDDATFESWGSPFYMPRDKLTRLMAFVASADPELIVVDFDVTTRGLDESADLELTQFLQAYPGPAHLVLTKRNLTDKKHFLAEVVANNPRVHWASAVFEREDDWFVRNGQLMSMNNPASALLSVAAFAQLAVNDSIDLDESHKEQTRKLTRRYAEKGNEGLRQKIFFTMPWQLSKGMRPPEVSIDGGDVPLYTIRSAQPVLEASAPLSNNWLAHRIVLIGGSYGLGRDAYPTALGVMPGIMIIANAIRSLIEVGQIVAPPLWLILILEVIAIGIMSVAFTRFPSLLGMTLSGLVIICACIPLSYYLLTQGQWFNFAIPLMAVHLMHLVLRASRIVEEAAGTGQ